MNRECPYCHKQISTFRCLNAYRKNFKYVVKCPECKNSSYSEKALSAGLYPITASIALIATLIVVNLFDFPFLVDIGFYALVAALCVLLLVFFCRKKPFELKKMES